MVTPRVDMLAIQKVETGMPPVRHLNIYLAVLLQGIGHNDALSHTDTFDSNCAVYT